MRFLDTNILIYSVLDDPSEAGKTKIARDLLRSDDMAISVQVLQEFYTQATRETRRDPLSHQDTLIVIDRLARLPVQETTVDLFYAAVATKARYQISYWDAAIVEAARALGCAEILTEDLSDGQDFDGVRVRNPFRDV